VGEWASGRVGEWEDAFDALALFHLAPSPLSHSLPLLLES